MSNDQRNITALNFYRATELHGALILAHLARRTSDPKLIIGVTRCSAQQILHSQQLAELIVSLGGAPAPVRATYQDMLAEVAGAPVTVVEVLVMTQTVERWMRRSDAMWIQSWLDDHSRKHGTEVSDVTRRYAQAEMRIARLSERNGSSTLDNLRKPERVPVGKTNTSV